MSTIDIRNLLNTMELIENEQINELDWKKTAQVAPLMALGILDADPSQAIELPTQGGSEYSATVDPEFITKKPQSPQSKSRVGGWYPVMFDKYSVEKMDALVDNYNQGRVHNMVVTYDQNSELAKKIANNLRVLTGEEIELKHTPQPYNPETEFERGRVTVLVN